MNTKIPHSGDTALSTKESSHDTFVAENHKNWLVNGAGLGAYAHGRVHQQFGNVILVSDIIHKRGHLNTDDILKMEEQALLSTGDPLSANSRLGKLVALLVMPVMGSSNGEGALVGYYQNGVVEFRTFEAPRETRFDASGKMLQGGWDTKRLVNHLLNTVSAVGRYAVSDLPRDHVFRSSFGIHFLQFLTGSAVLNAENVNRFSHGVDPLLELDPSENLTGAAVGFWARGGRIFATTGLVADELFSSSSYGRGFVSWNQASRVTGDMTPIGSWEGLWVPDSRIEGVHAFVRLGEDRADDRYGFIASDKTSKIVVAEIDEDLEVDVLDGIPAEIEWLYETGQFAPVNLSTLKTVQDCVIELTSKKTSRVKIYAKTENSDGWVLWREVSVCPKTAEESDKVRSTFSIGRPPEQCREFSWIQLKLEGIGYAELHFINLDFSASSRKSRDSKCFNASVRDSDYFKTNTEASNERWK
jgi:hypothetical protein